MSGLDLDAGADEVFEAIKGLRPEEFDELMEEPESRGRLLAVLIDHMAGLFRPDRAGDLEAVIHVKLWDRPGGGYDHFELLIEGGECTISARPQAEEPRLTIKIRPGDLRRLLVGETGPRRLVMRRRLTVLGDLRLGTRLQDLFAF